MYEPPRPTSLAAIASLLRVAMRGDGDLLSLLPAKAYRVDAGWMGYSRRSILIVNDPEMLREVMTDPLDIFPKSDLMVGALEPLVGNSIFVSHGSVWRRQRKMIEPSFSHMRLGKAFASMSAAVDDYESRLDSAAAAGESFSLDLAMSHLTADIICRTVFSTSLKSQTAIDVFEAFTFFERTCAQVELRRLIFDPPFSSIPQQPSVLEACERIRRHLSDLVDTHLSDNPLSWDDIAAEIIAARDLETGEGFTRKELLDQLGVMFLAGHETTASSLTWAFLIISMQPALAHRIREEVRAVAGDEPLTLEQVRKLTFVRNVFRESLRLYPPIPFMPRVAAEAATIGRHKVKRGAMIMVSPWTIHRHRDHWRHPHAFDPDRFSPEREHELVPGAYLPFGLGPRTCVGAGFATLEATLILARLVCRYDIQVIDAAKVRPIARLTIRPQKQLMARVVRRVGI
ncbi:MAG: cytochrome P450 [Gammaproteobacteria bacterium]|nr:cytochrome P450 [Gammaproteobacteria bacterium]